MGLMSKIASSKLGMVGSILAGAGAVFIPTYEMLNPPTVYSQEIQSDGDIGEFLDLNKKGRINYLENLSLQLETFEEGTFWPPITKSGYNQILDLKKELDTLYKESDDEKVNNAFLDVHSFILKNYINFEGQGIVVWNNDGEVDINEFIWNIRKGEPVYDSGETNNFLKDSKEGPLLTDFMKKVKKVKGSELSKIKKIYDLVAYDVPRYKWYNGEGERGEHGYQTFEQLLENRAGICTEKNALLAYALQKAGIDAYLWGFNGHIYNRILTLEGVLEVDVTSSEPFNLSKLSTKGIYSFSTNKKFYDDLPDNIRKYGQNLGDNDYNISIPLDSEENIEYVANNFAYVPANTLREILSKISNVKPHPLYGLVKNSMITPKNAGKYKKDLFR